MADVLDDVFGSSSSASEHGEDANSGDHGASLAGHSVFDRTTVERCSLLADELVDMAMRELREGGQDVQSFFPRELAMLELVATGEAAAAQELATLLWAFLEANKRWPHPALRQAFCACQARIAADMLQKCREPVEAAKCAAAAVAHLDRAYVMCGRQELVSIASALDSTSGLHARVGGGAAGGQLNGVRLPDGATAASVIDDSKKAAVADGGAIERLDNSLAEAAIGDVAAAFEPVFRARRPVVLPSGVITKGWSALQTWCNLANFVTAHGHRIVPVEIGRNSLVGSRGGADAAAPADGDGAWRECFMPLKDFAVTYLRPSIDAYAADLTASPRGTLPPGGKVGYVAQHGLFDQIPVLLRDLRPPAAIANRCNGGRGVLKMNTWLGTHGTVTPLHYDTYDNFLVQVAGVKYVRLYGIDQTPYLYADDAGAGGNLAQRNMCPIDVENPDFERFPRFATARHTDVVLMPGEALFIPQGVWHYVRSVTPSFSVNFWF